MKRGLYAKFVKGGCEKVKLPFSKDETSVRHRFDRLCQMALKGEAANYYKCMDNRRKHEIMLSELSKDDHHGRGIHSVNSWTVETTATK